MRWGWVLMLLLAGIAASLSIGVAPGVINFGEVQPGKRYVGESYLLTLSGDKLLVDLLFKHPHIRWMLNPGPEIDYDYEEASEEDISSWVKFPRNPELIDPAYKTIIRLENGQVIAANKKMTFYLDIPEDAEPGYHMGSIVPKPRTTAGAGMGVSTVAVSAVIFTFKVPGEVIRDFEAVAAEARRASDNQVFIDVLIRNKGTVTASVRVKGLKVFDNDGNILAVMNSGYLRIPPGQTSIVTLVWNSRSRIESGTYPVKITLDWRTGESESRMEVVVPEKITVAKKQPKKQCSPMPIWLIILLALLSLGAVYMLGGFHPGIAAALLAVLGWRIFSCGQIEWLVIGIGILSFIYSKVMEWSGG